MLRNLLQNIHDIHQANWFAAFQDCQVLGMQLLTIKTEKENRQVLQAIKSKITNLKI